MLSKKIRRKAWEKKRKAEESPEKSTAEKNNKKTRNTGGLFNTWDFDMELWIHDFSAQHVILKAHKGPTVGAEIPGHALYVSKTQLSCTVMFF